MAELNDKDLKALRADLLELHAIMNKAISEMHIINAEFKTWRVTRCEDHHRRIQAIEDGEKIHNKVIYRAAGIASVIPTIIMIITLILLFGDKAK